MRYFVLFFILLPQLVFSQSDALISYSGCTELKLSPDVGAFNYIGLAQPNQDDSEAPFHWQKRTALFMGIGIRPSRSYISNEGFETYSTLGFEKYFHKNWGYSARLNYQLGWGAGRVSWNAELNLNLLYRRQLGNSRWSFQNEVGLNYNLRNAYGIGELGFHFAPGINYRISDSFEIGSSFNFDYYNSLGLHFAPTTRLVFRF